jgi:hypothetical protein
MFHSVNLHCHTMVAKYVRAGLDGLYFATVQLISKANLCHNLKRFGGMKNSPSKPGLSPSSLRGPTCKNECGLNRTGQVRHDEDA